MDNARALVGERIRVLRKEKSWSQEDLGEKADLHYTYIGAVERGEKNASIDTLDKIATALGIDIGDLFAYSPRRTNADKLRVLLAVAIKESLPELLKLIAELVEEKQTTRGPKPEEARREKPAKKGA